MASALSNNSSCRLYNLQPWKKGSQLMRETVTIRYTFKSADMDSEVELLFSARDFSFLNTSTRVKEWVKLTHYQCGHCLLSEESFPICPLAGAIDIIISKLHNFLSYDEIEAQVEYRNRITTSSLTMQRALSSLLGLIIPASGCPYTAFFRPMSRFHLPFADTEETIYRATSMFLLAQYFLNRESGCIPTDFSRLEKIYNDVHIVNRHICKRLVDVCETDCSLNAIAILDMFTVSLHSSLRHDLQQLEEYFSVYSKDFIFKPGDEK